MLDNWDQLTLLILDFPAQDMTVHSCEREEIHNYGQHH